ncbi:hypothetical protein BJ508DRAFT_416621 [Ascobolus immersus RN42]|uniref:Cap binding protein n=1 Tax=Ascobolus immersus RN42 TaxID=1160509 RepID=A0A3N4I241_ASCIM|nr:hypothetical protein BJ508DRAFT_416621 [Ascobolus immersus RN42]
MSDYYRGGGRPGGGGGYGRKRRYRDEDDFEPRYSRPRYEETLFSRIRKETLTLAETPLVKTEDAISTVAKNVTDNYEDEEVRRGFMDLVSQLVIEQPFKIPFVACVVMLINSTTPELATMILEEMAKEAAQDLEKGELTSFKLRLRFFGCLQGILEGEGVFPTLNNVVEKARILQENGELEISLELVKIALINLPYIMASPAIDQREKALEIIEKATPIVHKSHALKPLQKPFTNIDEYEIGTPVVQLLHQQLVAESESGWDLLFLPRPWEEFRDRIRESQKQKMPAMELPEDFSHVPADSIIPEHFFSVYFSQTVETIPPPNNIACCILRDAVTDTADTLNFNRLAVARFLIDIDCYFAADAFIKRATPYDRVQEKAKGSTWKSEDVAVDAIFAQLFRLPKPKHKMVYYHSVLTEICKLAPAAIAPSLGRAIRCLYNNLESLDVELINRFVDWFSHHLSNFGFTWKWAEWVQHLALPNIHPKKAFIIETLEKEIRLSFTGRIKSTLPDEYQSLLSPGKELDTPVFKYDLPTTPLAAEAQGILTLLKDRKPEEELDAALASLTEKATALGSEVIADPAAFARDVYVQSICHIGSKSLSHVLSCIERCKSHLLRLGAEAPLARREIIASVMSYWADHPGVGANVVDKLLNYSILTPASVVEWVLAEDSGRSLARSHAWEMVATTIGKVNNRVKQLVAAKPTGEAVDDIAPEVLEAFNQTLDNAKIEQKQLAELLLGGLRDLAANPPNVEVPEEEENPVTEQNGDQPMEDQVVGQNDAGDIIIPKKLTKEERLEEQKRWIKWWAENWKKTFTRKFKVEEGVLDGTEFDVTQ